MARPIAPTPELDAKASRDFLDRVNHGLKTPARLVPTPKVKNALSKIMADARKQNQK